MEGGTNQHCSIVSVHTPRWIKRTREVVPRGTLSQRTHSPRPRLMLTPVPPRNYSSRCFFLPLGTPFLPLFPIVFLPFYGRHNALTLLPWSPNTSFTWWFRMRPVFVSSFSRIRVSTGSPPGGQTRPPNEGSFLASTNRTGAAGGLHNPLQPFFFLFFCRSGTSLLQVLRRHFLSKLTIVVAQCFSTAFAPFRRPGPGGFPRLVSHATVWWAGRVVRSPCSGISPALVTPVPPRSFLQRTPGFGPVLLVPVAIRLP